MTHSFPLYMQEYFHNLRPFNIFAFIPGESGAGSVIEGSGSPAGEGVFKPAGFFLDFVCTLK